MKAQDLKNSILKLAIQGKLVEQLEEEGMYQQIQEEKKKLVKEGKIKKPKKLQEIAENEIPFDIPEKWEWVRLGDIFKINPRNNVNDDFNVSFIPMALIKDGYQSKFSYEIKSWSEVKKGYTHFSDGDIVMAKITPCFQNLKSAVMANLENGVGAGTTELHVLRAYYDISLEFFLWLIKGPIFVSTCVAKMTGTAGQKRVGTDTITNYVAPLPPLEEQKRIVAKIEELMPYVEKYDKAYSEVEELNKKFPEDMQKSILQYAIQGKLVEQREEDGTAEELYQRIQEEKKKLVKEGKIKKSKTLPEITEGEIPFDIPESWKWVRLNDILNFIDYRGKTPNKISSGVVLITASNIRNGFLDFSKEDFVSETEYYERMSRGITRKGDILFTTEAPLGNVAINTIKTASCGQRVITFQHYGEMKFPSSLFQQELLDNATGTTAKGIKAARLKNLLIPFPPLKEQERIVAKLKELLPYTKQLVKE